MPWSAIAHSKKHRLNKTLTLPEERQSDQPILLNFCELKFEEVSGHEREQQARRQLLIPSPLQTNDTEP